MGNELLLIIGFTIFSLVVTMAWVGGYLDTYQHTLQNVILDKTGENRASYGLKTVLTGQKTGDQDLDAVQDGVGSGVGGLVGKGGVGESIGSTLSKGL
ncbi:hypothetical protein HO173_001800 [Letharia columbiana]|uniref:Uncharacterized protein n=1 Tax=Letharia columbiana TaxID=112416 RepID=A0A8H6G4D8_9LECA|nr:uncharacterized protein HO173_001800 [Letharia columbiana]KAF6240190.1 hypothetical protein HO173_001800 [Letharia columbiana]